MTYQDFLSSLVSPITSFVSWFSMVANSLIHNYFFITMLGIVLFISLVWLVYDIIDYFLYSHINDYDDFENKYYDYKLFKEVQKEYYKNNPISDNNISNSDNINTNSSLNFVSNVKSSLPVYNLIPMSRSLKLSSLYNYDYFNNVYLDSKDNTFYNFANNDEVVSFIHNNFVVDSKDHNYLINKNDNSRVKRYVKSYDSNDNLLDLYNNIIVDSKDNTFYSYRN